MNNDDYVRVKRSDLGEVLRRGWAGLPADTDGRLLDALQSTAVQVVGPGKVAVSRHGLYAYLLHTGKAGGPYTDALREELRAALADADVQDSRTDTETEHAEDSGSCGECGVWTAYRTRGVCPGCYEQTDEADAQHELKSRLADAEPAPDSGQGETNTSYTQRKYADLNGYADGGLLSGPIPFELDNGYITPKRNPAAEPPKADAADTDAEPLTPGELDYTEFLTQMVSRAEEMATARAKLHANIAADRAAKRGRDEALAVVVKALRQVQSSEARDPVADRDPLDLARRIEREQGGDL